ncbi:flagellar hook-associated protein FlgL [Simiduia agarivorans]|uniref:Flagellar hook-associated protein 3 n=1 Tax=Simiduia agarivorans (strain DSM 21679 / JCM 13881 / BCRC 17597 / SA1) TaxID=1117647 RepID=K4KHN2_SIMAS|nr:flagellar hook-associated protein FlgL [Simiduia agarivorans]AFU97670.1 flagellar hook-associated protein 3 [Simiduia agarivorans SA1 = DSM 21679]
MRVSTSEIFNVANRGISDANSAMVKTQEQLSTGLRVLRPSDDPVASTKIMQLNDTIARIGQFTKNINSAENDLQLEETTLNGVLELIQRVQELTVQAGNTATLTPSDYKALAAEVDARLEELLNQVNTRNANGDYIFAGYKGGTQPFERLGPGQFTYSGDEGQKLVKISESVKVPVSDSGKALFMDIAAVEATLRTHVSAANKSVPPITVSVGQVYDQDVFDQFYPGNMVVTFNHESAVTPAAKNFTITERDTGKVLLSNQPFISGASIQVAGASFTITGQPASGTPPVPATRPFGADAPVALPFDFTPPANESLIVEVNGRRETLVLDANVTSTADIAAILNNAGNGNAARLANLGVTVTAAGFSMSAGVNFTVLGGTGNIDAVMGLNTSLGTSSVNGQRAIGGDQVFVDSADNQDLLLTLARLSDAMKTVGSDAQSKAVLKSVVDLTLGNLTNAQTNLLEVTSRLGARFNTIASTKDLHLDTELVGKEVLSELQDLDYAEAASRLSKQELVLQAAQSTFVRISQLSLFDRL